MAHRRRTSGWGRVGTVLGAAVLLVGCAGGTDVGVGPTDPPTTSPDRSPSGAIAPDHVTLVYDVGGGCYDAEDTSGCGPSEPVPVTDAEDGALVAASAARLAALPVDESVGCGAEYVDGLSVRVVIEVSVGDEVDREVVCLSDAPPDDPAVALLWSLAPGD